MENIDEREIDAARFFREVVGIWREHHTQVVEDGLRLTVLLLFTEFLETQEQLPWTRLDLQILETLPQTMARAHEFVNLPYAHDARWDFVSEAALRSLWDLVGSNYDSAVVLKRLDFLVLELGAIHQTSASSRRLEQFMADFAQAWSLGAGDIVDLNLTSNGELGVRLDAIDSSGAYTLPVSSNPHHFEVCLRLHAHRVRFRLINRGRSTDYLSNSQTFFKFPPIGRSSARRPAAEVAPWDAAGLEFAEWFFHAGNAPRLAVIALPTSDLRAAGWRQAARTLLLSEVCVIGVVEVPLRVSGSLRLSLLILRAGARYGAEPVLLMNGRAVDGLRDEPLDRLAQFLSIPFISLLSRYELARPYHADTLGESLDSRARKMFHTDTREIAGFFRYVYTEDILNSGNASLDPAHWIPQREPLASSDLLDGAPVHSLLTRGRGACCIYVIGNNGAGKSMLLRQLAEALCASGRPVRAIASASSDRFVTKVGPDVDYLYLGARTSDTATHPRKLGRKLAALVLQIHQDLLRATAFDQALGHLSFSGRHFLLPEAANSDLLQSVKELGRDPITGNLAGWKLGFQKAGANSIVPFDHLSTGEQQVLLLTARLIAHAAPGVVFLVDEPETSLHVAWQRSLPQVFQTISREFECQLVIATHSPVLISTARGDDAFRFMADGGLLEELGEKEASSVERVLFRGFETYTGNNREVHERCAELMSQAIEWANTSRGEMLIQVQEELDQMRAKVKKSVPALGSDVTALHLDLIRRAKEAVTDLARSTEPQEQE